MQKKKISKNESNAYLTLFRAMKGFVSSATSAQKCKGRMYSLCVRASLSKCFEFNLSVHDSEQSDDAFFFLPALRGICEDLIVFNYLQTLDSTDREELVGLLAMHGVYSGMLIQRDFFRVARPQQVVLCIKDADQEKRNLESQIRAIWNRSGWPNMNRGVLPATQEIAQKQGATILGVLYEYLFRLTSATVHFNIGSLLRSGWGPSPSQFAFTPRNFSAYSTMYAQVYGSFLFCVYFELFGRFLRPASDVKKHVAEIRKHLLYESRWPEMVTFEEMNIEPPKFRVTSVLVSAFQAQKIHRLIDIGKDGG